MLSSEFSKRAFATAICFALATWMLAGAPASAGTAYTITPLGLLPGDSESIAFGINDSGQVVGLSYTYGPPPEQAFIYTNGALQPLGVTPAISGGGFGINSSGQIVGSASPFEGAAASQAFLYSGGTLQYFPAMAGANAINASGEFVGDTSATYGSNHAALYSGGQVHDLGTLGGSASYAYAINNAGQVVGQSDVSATSSHAFLYSGSTLQDLGTLGGSYSTANGINDLGQIVGTAETQAGANDAFLYSNGTMQDLGTLGYGSSNGWGINNSGVVVGQVYNASTSHGFVYADGTMYDLNTLIPADSGYEIWDAIAINNNGLIVADAMQDNDFQAVILTPTSVPLPTAAWAMLTALPLLLILKQFRPGMSR